MLNVIFNELLELLKAGDLIELGSEKITSSGNYLVFADLVRQNANEQTLHFTLFVARNSLSKDPYTALKGIDDLLELCEEQKANTLKSVQASILSWDSVKLSSISGGLFVYEITLSLKIRL